MKRVRPKRHVPVKVGGLAPTVATLDALRQDLQAIANTHPELYGRLYELIGWLLLPDGFVWAQPENREAIRHLVVRLRLERGDKWDDALHEASAELRNHPAAAGPDRMAAAYKSIERGLPPKMQRAKRRPR
jgi:hypothetical protein